MSGSGTEMTQYASGVPTPAASEKDFHQGPVEEGLSDEEEGPSLEDEAVLEEPKEKLGSKLRRRKRDGKIVGRSSIVYSIYKKSRRKLQKKRLFFTDEFEDSHRYDRVHVMDWVQVRHYQCRWLANLLAERKVVSKEVTDASMYEIESVLDWVLANRNAVAVFDMGSALLWVIMLVQMNYSLSQDAAWEFDDDAVRNTMSVENLWAEAAKLPPSTDQHTHVKVAPIGKLNNHLGPASSFKKLLERCKVSDEEHTFRATRTAEPRLYPGIVTLDRAVGAVWSHS